MSKFYCHVHLDGGGEPRTFIAHADGYNSVTALLEDVRSRYAIEGPLDVLLNGKAVTSIASIPNKGDVIVQRSKRELVEQWKKEGNALLVAGKLEEAVQMYGKALDVATEQADIAVLHCNRALAYLKLESWVQATQDAKMAATLDPKNVKARYRWGQGLVGQGNYVEAQRVLGEALDLEDISNQQALEVGQLIAKCEKLGGLESHVNQTDVASARTARLPVSVYTRLKPYYEVAIRAMEGAHWAQAINVYKKILEINPTDYTSLLGLGSCLLRNKSHHYTEAVEVLQRLCDAHGEGSFEGWRMLGEAQYGAGMYAEALDSYGKAANYTQVVEEGWNAQEQRRIVDMRTKDLKVYAARALAAQHKYDVALHFVSQVLSGDANYVPALLEYVELMMDYQKAFDEAVKASVKTLTLASKDRTAKRLFCRAISHPGMMGVLFQLLGNDIAASGLAFLASVAKEYSAIPAAVQLYERCAKKEPHNASHWLNLIHTLEIEGDHDAALRALRQWLEHDPALKVSVPATGKSISAAEVLRAWDAPVQADEAGGRFGALLREPRTLGKPEWASHADLDFLALCFALVKILFIRGDLGRIPALVRLIESVREGWEFHLTVIRNEQAYYCCAAQSLEWHSLASTLAITSREANSPTQRMYVVGDSHSLPLSWMRVAGGSVVLEPRLVTGCKMWHLREEGTFFPKYNFIQAMNSLPRESKVIIVLGEIDCREGLLVCVEKGRYASLEEGAETVIKIFVRCMLNWVEQKKFSRVYIHPVVPVLDATRHIVEIYNGIYRAEVCKHPQLIWLDLYDKLVIPVEPNEKIRDCHSSWKLNPKYALDGTHLSPAYVSDCLEPALLRAEEGK